MWINHIAGRKNARHIGPRSFLVDEITVRVHFKFAPKWGCIRRMPNRNENAFHSQSAYVAGLNVLQFSSCHFTGFVSLVAGNNCIPNSFDLWALQGAIGHNRSSSERFPPVDQVDDRSEFGKKDSFLARSIAAPDYANRDVTVESSIASGAGSQSMAFKLFLVF